MSSHLGTWGLQGENPPHQNASSAWDAGTIKPSVTPRLVEKYPTHPLPAPGALRPCSELKQHTELHRALLLGVTSGRAGGGTQCGTGKWASPLYPTPLPLPSKAPNLLLGLGTCTRVLPFPFGVWSSGPSRSSLRLA